MASLSTRHALIISSYLTACLWIASSCPAYACLSLKIEPEKFSLVSSVFASRLFEEELLAVALWAYICLNDYLEGFSPELDTLATALAIPVSSTTLSVPWFLPCSRSTS